MKKILLGMLLGALLGGAGVKAHDTFYDTDDIMEELKTIKSDLDFMQDGINLLVVSRPIHD